MKDLERWRETRAILGTISRLSEPRLAVVVRLEGSGYRRPGAKLLLDGDTIVAGVISGGCLEEDLRLHARDLVGGRVLSYDTGADAEMALGIPLGCDGRLDVLLLTVTASQTDDLEAAGRSMDAYEPLTLRLGLGPDGRSAVEVLRGLCAGPRYDREGGHVFVDPLPPPPTLTLFGDGSDTEPLARLAGDLGFRVMVVDHRGMRHLGSAVAERVQRRPEDGVGGLATGPGDMAVVKMHHGQYDQDWLEALAATSIGYIGVVGPRRRTARMLTRIGVEGDERIHGPVGLDVGAEGAGQIAVSVVAELLAAQTGRAGGRLRDRAGRVHARAV